MVTAGDLVIKIKCDKFIKIESLRNVPALTNDEYKKFKLKIREND
jgi:hypothetical protein